MSDNIDYSVELPEKSADMDSSNLKADLENLLNKYSRENISNTPDYILQIFLWNVLRAYENAVSERDKWVV